MKIPKYVIDIASRSEFDFDRACDSPMYAVGYTIAVCKKTPYTTARIFRSEMERFRKWCGRQHCTMDIIYVPKVTKHEWQYATVTVFDPVMQQIEKYIKNQN